MISTARPPTKRCNSRWTVSANEIDLAEKNAQKLRSELQPWVTAGRRTGGSRRHRGVRSASASIGRTDSAAIREWARKSGHEIAKRGRIAVEVIDAYRAAY